MNGKGKLDGELTTELDARHAQPRLKEGLFAGETWIHLRIVGGEESGRVYTLSPGGVYLIGRRGADIDLDDKKVSRKHAEIGLYGPEACFIRDLASTNGIWLNGKRVSDRAKLHDADLIQIGDTILRFAVYEKSVPVSQP